MIWTQPIDQMPYIGLIYGRYLHFRFLKWPLTCGSSHSKNLYSPFNKKAKVLLVLLKELGTSRYHLPVDTKMTGNKKG